MKTNNKGFAISIMLYAMVLLIVTIFYIIVAIVKNRYNVSEELVDKAVSFMAANDSYASASDKAAPLIVFNQGTKVVKDSFNDLVIYVFDDSINSSNITMKANNSNVGLTCTLIDSTTNYRCVPNSYNISRDTNITVTAKDNNGNVSTEMIKFYKAAAPNCQSNSNKVKVIDEKTCNANNTSCRELAKEGSAYILYYGDYVMYEITCYSTTGVDAFFKKNDFVDANNEGVLTDFKITTERFPSKTVIKITARAKVTTSQDASGVALTRPRLKSSTEADARIKICDGYKGTDANNCQEVDLPYLKITSPYTGD